MLLLKNPQFLPNFFETDEVVILTKSKKLGKNGGFFNNSIWIYCIIGFKKFWLKYETGAVWAPESQTRASVDRRDPTTTKTAEGVNPDSHFSWAPPSHLHTVGVSGYDSPEEGEGILTV